MSRASLCQCCSCGYKWQRGADGSHYCADTLKARAEHGCFRISYPGNYTEVRSRIQITFRDLAKGEEFYETLVRLCGGEYTAPARKPLKAKGGPRS